MAIRNIVKTGDPVLTKVCRPVERFDAKLHQLLDDMYDTIAHRDSKSKAIDEKIVDAMNKKNGENKVDR